MPFSERRHRPHRTGPFLLLLLLTFLVAGCATDVTGVTVDELSYRITTPAGEPVEALLPGERYLLRIDLRAVSGKQYDRPDHRDLRLTHLRRLELIERRRHSLLLRSARESFHPPGSRAYAFTLRIAGNPYPGKRVQLDLDRERYHRLDYGGAPGGSGADGADGRPGGSAPVAIGGGGAPGEDGRDGGDGREVRLAVARYDWGGVRKLILYDTERKQLYLFPPQSVVIDASGGDGGNGGDGGDGVPDPEQMQEEQDGHRFLFVIGARGGDGGDGGDGGKITLLAAEPELFSYLSPRVRGGRGGYGGDGGRGIAARDGENGRDGRAGRVRYLLRDSQELRRIFAPVEEAGFDPERLILR